MSAKKCDCLEKRIANNRLTFANIPNAFKDLTIKSFDTDIYKTTNGRQQALNVKKMCYNYVKNYELMQAKGKGLYLYSEVKGSGKTRMAVSIANALINNKNVRARFATSLQILEEIKNTYNKDNNETESKLIKELSSVDVIIIDDLGVEQEKSWVNEKFYSIINSRMLENKVTIFTSNCKIEKLKLDDRIKNRVAKMTIQIEFPAESIRGYIAKSENKELINFLLG